MIQFNNSSRFGFKIYVKGRMRKDEGVRVCVCVYVRIVGRQSRRVCTRENESRITSRSINIDGFSGQVNMLTRLYGL